MVCFSICMNYASYRNLLAEDGGFEPPIELLVL